MTAKSLLITAVLVFFVAHPLLSMLSAFIAKGGRSAQEVAALDVG
jgi:hypothetical protein